MASSDFATASPIRTVIAADFDNNGNLDVFLNNIVYRREAPNRVFEIVPNGNSVNMIRKDIGDAEERNGYGTGVSRESM